jgi:hypothetical protein
MKTWFHALSEVVENRCSSGGQNLRACVTLGNIHRFLPWLTLQKDVNELSTIVDVRISRRTQ